MSEQQEVKDLRQDRTKRVQRLKKILIISFIAAILLPIILCIVMMVKISHLEQRIAQIYEARLTAEPAAATEEVEEVRETMETILTAGDAIQSVTAAVLQEHEAESAYSVEKDASVRKVYLTFDDGPSMYTDEILDILKEENVKATFFVTAKKGAEYEKIYRRIVAEGHTLGMHSYSHRYEEIYASEENFMEDMHKLQDYLEEVTGEKPMLCRFPGGSSNTVSKVPMQDLIRRLEQEGIRYFDWNVSSADATGSHPSVDTIVYNCTGNITEYNRAMILMHDAADKRRTVEALPIVIEKLKAVDDTVIVPVTEETEVIQHIVS